MTISRTAAAAYLSSQFSALAGEVGQTATDDSATGYGPDVDNALRVLGVAEADLAAYAVAEADRTKYFVLLDAFAARRFCNQLAYSINVSLGPQSESGASTAAQRVCELADAYARSAAELGVPIDGVDADAWQVGTLTADWQEPDGSRGWLG